MTRKMMRDWARRQTPGQTGIADGRGSTFFLAGSIVCPGQVGVLLVFQAMDAAGKDGAIRHVMSGVNPQGCQVTSFKAPSAEELDHDYLWRCMKNLPERGRIGIFNRSYYEEVLAVRVHKQFLDDQKITKGINYRRYLGRPSQRHPEF